MRNSMVFGFAVGLGVGMFVVAKNAKLAQKINTAGETVKTKVTDMVASGQEGSM